MYGTAKGVLDGEEAIVALLGGDGLEAILERLTADGDYGVTEKLAEAKGEGAGVRDVHL